MANGSSNVTPLPRRDDPKREPLSGNIKVTRKDWLDVAMDVLVSDGVEQVKVLNLAERLGVSRSSFYWYFKSRKDLLNALLAHWEATNTAILIDHASAPSETIAGAVLYLFRCFIDPDLFNTGLDFAVRDWARRDGKVRRILDLSDAARVEALQRMFARHGYEAEEAHIRARILYYMQIGYNIADLNETVEQRTRLGPLYVVGFTGEHASAEEIEAHTEYAAAVLARNRL
ncbi:MAG: TetR/AcrR family transcriptional regulator [Nitratireductor sp.]|nr:TetR/AcrR family transcriptional regulator [Nitratireductor sp.]